ncbi:MAG: peroxidase-related enzyme [Calditrichia bacterium]
MSWIPMIEPENAEGVLKELYGELQTKRGKISNIMKIHSLHPETMRDHLNLYLTLMFGKSPLSRAEREMIGVVVSAANQCQYCIHHHKEALLFYWKDEQKIHQLITEPEKAPLSDREKAMVAYVRQLTHHPEKTSISSVERLKDAGLNDREILDCNLICSYFNFVNRIVLGLGVSFSEEEMKGYKY